MAEVGATLISLIVTVTLCAAVVLQSPSKRTKYVVVAFGVARVRLLPEPTLVVEGCIGVPLCRGIGAKGSAGVAQNDVAICRTKVIALTVAEVGATLRSLIVTVTLCAAVVLQSPSKRT